MDRLKGKCALITGGTTGIGLETAHAFLREGARIAITGQNPATLESARKELGAGALVLPSDASDPADQQKLAEAVRDAFGKLDILFANAGVVELKPVGQWNEAAFDRSFAVNVKGPFFLIQSLLPVFANPASIVLNASVNAHVGMPNTSVVWSGDTANVVYPWRSAAVTVVFTCGTWPTTETTPDLPNAFTVVPSRKYTSSDPT